VSKRGTSEDVARESDSMGGSRILTTLTTSLQRLLSAAPALYRATSLQCLLSPARPGSAPLNTVNSPLIAVNSPGLHGCMASAAVSSTYRALSNAHIARALAASTGSSRSNLRKKLCAMEYE
jgi:hypothetical protein